MSEPQSLFQHRPPYANEAKAIIAAQLKEKCSPEIAEWFEKHWEVKLRVGAGHLVIRDTFITPGELKDDWVFDAIKELYSTRFTKKGDKIEASVNLPNIEAPTGQKLKGASGKVCCHGGACIGCPNYRA